MLLSTWLTPLVKSNNCKADLKPQIAKPNPMFAIVDLKLKSFCNLHVTLKSQTALEIASSLTRKKAIMQHENQTLNLHSR
jgi:hypothetical protein